MAGPRRAGLVEIESNGVAIYYVYILCPVVEQMVEKTQQGFEQLLQALDPQRYPRTRTYIENLMAPVATFLKHRLDNGEVNR